MIVKTIRMTLSGHAWIRARPKRCKLANNGWLRQAVVRKLGNWAPEQIAGWLKRAHPKDECYQVSHETIYRSLFVQARGVLKKELLYGGDGSDRLNGVTWFAPLKISLVWFASS
jgi:IS30 family transposase